MIFPSSLKRIPSYVKSKAVKQEEEMDMSNALPDPVTAGDESQLDISGYH
jgi:hypothetical protein